MHRLLPMFAITLLCPGLPLFAEEAVVFSGPQVGDKLAPFKIVGSYNEYKGVQLDPVKMADGKPMILVFVHDINRPATTVARALIHYGEMRKKDGLVSASVVLTDDTTASQQLMDITQWWSDGSPMGLSLDGLEGPGSYGLNRNVTLTVLIAKDNVVTANFALIQPSLSDVPRILKEVQKLIGGEPVTMPEVSFLACPSRLPYSPGPKDLKVRELICELLRTGDRKFATEVEAYVGSDEKKQIDVGGAARFVLGGAYGGKESIVKEVPELRAVFETWAEKYPAKDLPPGKKQWKEMKKK